MKLFINIIFSNNIEVIKLVKVLIIDDDFQFIKILINDVLNGSNVKVCKLLTNGNEIFELLSHDDFDIILLNSTLMPFCNNLNLITELFHNSIEKYKNSIIISHSSSVTSSLLDNPLVYDCIIKEDNINNIISKVNGLIERKDVFYKKNQIFTELKSIGYDINYKGTRYLAEAILQMYINNNSISDNLQKDIYPLISKLHNKTVNNIKCNINNATECMYYTCDSKKLKTYFSFFDDVKPTTKTVIYTILNKIF